MIHKLSLPETIPDNYEEEYNYHTKQGHRVLAMGYKYFPDFDKDNVDTLDRNNCEKDIIFLGLLIMVNELKSATKESIENLKNGGVVTIMATGDNILTGINKSAE